MNLRILNSSLKCNILLFLTSFTIYFFYFHEILLHPNTLLSGITGDALKNYYTFVFHIKNDAHFLHFAGLNDPYGEHVIYTDCQPLFTFILRLLPFTHNHLIGILHLLLFFSFIITPLFLNRIFILLKVDRVSSFFISLAITLLSPQYHKLLAGHYALAYACVIPMCILLLLNFMQQRKTLNLVLLFCFNLTIFFLHPYFGLGTSLFTFVSLVTYDCIYFKYPRFLFRMVQTVFTGLLPLIIFKIFMVSTDHHVNRPTEPENATTLIANPASLLHPNFGPFRDVLLKLFKIEGTNFEGYSYMGIFLIVIVFVSAIAIPWFRKKIHFQRDSFSIFVASLVLLFLAFGLHNNLLSLLKIKISALEQFRASGRFIWFFYYTLPIFLLPFIYHTLNNNSVNTKKTGYILKAAAVLYFSFNLLEANSLYRMHREAFWKYRNFFSERCLSSEENALITTLKKSNLQSIIPLPLYHAGSEMYYRVETESMRLSMMYSYHCDLPIVSSFLSRTSITETEEVIQTLNSYKKQHGIDNYLTGGDFLLIKSNDQLLPDEERLFKKSKVIHKDSMVQMALVKESAIFKRLASEKQVIISDTKVEPTYSCSLVYIESEPRKPFITSNLKNYEGIYTLDSNLLESGTYIMSLRYYYSPNTHWDVDCHFIVDEVSANKAEWIVYARVKSFNGFYKGYAVFEQKITINKNCKYNFMLNGNSDRDYKISHFLLRPENTDVLLVSGTDSIFNNFPE